MKEEEKEQNEKLSSLTVGLNGQRNRKEKIKRRYLSFNEDVYFMNILTALLREIKQKDENDAKWSLEKTYKNGKFANDTTKRA